MRPRTTPSLGCVLKAFGHGDEAVEALTRATTKDPAFYFAQVSLGDLLESLGRLDEAMAGIPEGQRAGAGQVLGSRGDRSRAHGSAPLRRRDRRAAGRDSIRATLWHAQLHTLLGDCWRAKGSPQQALVEYDQSIRIRPEDGYTMEQRREVMVQLGYAEATRAEWEQLLQWAPGRPRGLERLCGVVPLRRQPGGLRARVPFHAGTTSSRALTRRSGSEPAARACSASSTIETRRAPSR